MPVATRKQTKEQAAAAAKKHRRKRSVMKLTKGFVYVYPKTFKKNCDLVATKGGTLVAGTEIGGAAVGGRMGKRRGRGKGLKAAGIISSVADLLGL